MTLLILVLAIFAGVHLMPSMAPELKTAWHNKLSASEWKSWEKANESVRERQQKYDDDMKID